MAAAQHIAAGNRAITRSVATFSMSDWTAILMIVGFLCFPRTYAEIKIIVIALFVCLHLPKLFRAGAKPLDPLTVKFYAIVAGCGLIATARGFANGGDPEGIIDGFRLYVIWSIAFSTIVQMLLTTTNPFQILNVAMIASGIIISIMNGLAVYGARLGLDIFSDSFIKEMDLRVGFHDGYVQIVSQNIGSLFFIVPYLVCIFLRKDAISKYSRWAMISLICCLIITILSGRRALWIVAILTPWIALGFSYINKTSSLNRQQFTIVGGSLLVGFLALFYLYSTSGVATFDFLTAAFSAQDERTIQRSYLIDGFLSWPVLGSGFGVPAAYIRNAETPWIYELSYFQLLFNFGLLGSVLFLITGLRYFYLGLKLSTLKVRDFDGSFCLLVGLFGFMIGTYSNPYFGSFDFLFLLAMLPLIACISRRTAIA
jgi:hypothetical protein